MLKPKFKPFRVRWAVYCLSFGSFIYCIAAHDENMQSSSIDSEKPAQEDFSNFSNKEEQPVKKPRKHKYVRQPNQANPKFTKKTELLLDEALMLMTSGESEKAEDCLRELLSDARIEDPYNHTLLTKIQLAIEECLKIRFANARLVLKMEAISERIAILDHIKNTNSLSFCVTHNIYPRLIQALIEQCNPVAQLGAGPAKEALALLELYREILDQSDKLSIYKEALNELERRALYMRDYQLLISANEKFDQGLNVVGMRLLSEVNNPASPLYEQAQKALEIMKTTYCEVKC